ncbi:hypothetical protein R3P38DRAFT_3287192 [Favolaschia claudopus]|uniref:Uncharacterized protein n=1 Tax=Favolaschia claudopus TaxID=2862362 RepID=A0AAW0A0M4_9AGAR
MCIGISRWPCSSFSVSLKYINSTHSAATPYADQAKYLRLILFWQQLLLRFPFASDVVDLASWRTRELRSEAEQLLRGVLCPQRRLRLLLFSLELRSCLRLRRLRISHSTMTPVLRTQDTRRLREAQGDVACVDAHSGRREAEMGDVQRALFVWEFLLYEPLQFGFRFASKEGNEAILHPYLPRPATSNSLLIDRVDFSASPEGVEPIALVVYAESRYPVQRRPPSELPFATLVAGVSDANERFGRDFGLIDGPGPSGGPSPWTVLSSLRDLPCRPLHAPRPAHWHIPSSSHGPYLRPQRISSPAAGRTPSCRLRSCRRSEGPRFMSTCRFSFHFISLRAHHSLSSRPLFLSSCARLFDKAASTSRVMIHFLSTVCIRGVVVALCIDVNGG